MRRRLSLAVQLCALITSSNQAKRLFNVFVRRRSHGAAELKTLLAARGEKCLHVEGADKTSAAYDRV